ncbi:hypothetical protein H4R33_005649 [Dimargaris cristalligena]|uniref:Uncharacterized protein n=1 Tax=Dimargaris cristalligena TaxID=215637 RepID=A0A4P9ZQ14_9FUNG|nr:hypothetical protein H4R33_005649 [Dimargaris cristalligena]RKP34450.1 hypothetical protein BJ085DRAFT_38761 [Dimargaris cristalligena]|eukprot:RKP34450.1 hypothetical protein BJ085DRAFT_38761 [Dimargaris cristalligena]
MIATSNFSDLLFEGVTHLDTRSEDLEADLGCLEEKIHRERQTHQLILDAKNAMIDALYFKACRLEYASKKAMAILSDTQPWLAGESSELEENSRPTLGLSKQVRRSVELALRYLEVGQVPIEDEEVEESPLLAVASADRFLLDTYVSEDEEDCSSEESEIFESVENLPAAPLLTLAPAVETASHSLTLKSTPVKPGPSHPPTPESINVPSPAGPHTPMNHNQSQSATHTPIRSSVSPRSPSDWTPIRNSPASSFSLSCGGSQDSGALTPNSWMSDTPCRSVKSDRSGLQVSFAPLPMTSLSATPSLYSPTHSTSTSSSLGSTSSCGQCRRSMGLINTWQEERDTLRRGMDDLAFQLTEAHIKVDYAEDQYRRLREQLSPLHQNLKTFMVNQGHCADLKTPVAGSKSTIASVGAPEFASTNSAPADGLFAALSSTVSFPTSTSISNLYCPGVSALEDGLDDNDLAKVEHLTAGIIGDLNTWVNLLHQVSGRSGLNSRDRLRRSQSTISLRSPSSGPSRLSISPNFSLMVSPLSSPTQELGAWTSPIDQHFKLNASPAAPPVPRESLIDPFGATDTMLYLDRLLSYDKRSSSGPQRTTPPVPTAMLPVRRESIKHSSPSLTVHLDAITYTDFANFTLGLATRGAQESLLLDIHSDSLTVAQHWNQLPMAFQIVEEDIKPCLMIPGSGSAAVARHTGNPVTSHWLSQASSPSSAASNPNPARLCKANLLEAILTQRCEIIARSGASSPTTETFPAPKAAKQGDAIVLRGSAKQRVSIHDMSVAGTALRSPCTAVCALCGQERECEYKLSVPRRATSSSRGTTSDPLTQLVGRNSPKLNSPADGHSASPVGAGVFGGSGTLGKSWRAITSDLRWGRKGKSSAVHPMPTPHISQNTGSPHPPPSSSATTPAAGAHDDDQWDTHCIDRFCRDRIVTVCDLVGFLSHLSRGLWDHAPLISRYEKFVWHRQRINWARLGCLAMLEPEEKSAAVASGTSQGEPSSAATGTSPTTATATNIPCSGTLDGPRGRGHSPGSTQVGGSGGPVVSNPPMRRKSSHFLLYAKRPLASQHPLPPLPMAMSNSRDSRRPASQSTQLTANSSRQPRDPQTGIWSRTKLDDCQIVLVR